MRDYLERLWFGDGRGGFLWAPFEALFALIAGLRRLSYRWHCASSIHPGRPVIVVGNLTVGGSGKTPTLVWLAGALTARGVRVGVVSRGYGGTESGPTEVLASSNPERVGDEPVLIARRTKARVVVARDRVAAAMQLAPAVDVILADDGLQHYRLARDLEIVVVDGRRGFGNGRLLPRGPLREPLSRLRDVAAVIITGDGHPGVAGMRSRLVPTDIVALSGGARVPLADWAGRRVHAVAGIGDPERFFRTLEAAGLVVMRHPKADHAHLSAADVEFADGCPVLMTEKDAVKCGAFHRPGLYYLEVRAEPEAPAATALVDQIVMLAQRARGAA
jgi:tetraacyldisaccharide 4'-kinase